MECLLCGYHKVYRHGTTNKSNVRYECPNCKKIFVETLDTIYYHRYIDLTDLTHKKWTWDNICTFPTLL